VSETEVAKQDEFYFFIHLQIRNSQVGKSQISNFSTLVKISLLTLKEQES